MSVTGKLDKKLSKIDWVGAFFARRMCLQYGSSIVLRLIGFKLLSGQGHCDLDLWPTDPKVLRNHLSVFANARKTDRQTGGQTDDERHGIIRPKVPWDLMHCHPQRGHYENYIVKPLTFNAFRYSLPIPVWMIRCMNKTQHVAGVRLVSGVTSQHASWNVVLRKHDPVTMGVKPFTCMQ